MSELNINEYQGLALRTLNSDGKSLTNAALGLCGESGEIADSVKKHVFQGHVIDSNEILLELGDVLWYVALMASMLGFNLSDVMEANIEKLKKRYPEGFNEERSINRIE